MVTGVPRACPHDSVADFECQRCGVDMRPCAECRAEPGPDGVIRHIAGLHPAGREREIINELLDELAEGLEAIGRAIAKARRKLNEMPR